VDRSFEATSINDIQFGDVDIDLAGRRVTRADRTIHLTPTEFDLLAFLARRPGQVFTREQLLHEVWGYRDGSGARTVDSHVRALRRKLLPSVSGTFHGGAYAAGGEAAAPGAASLETGACRSTSTCATSTSATPSTR